MPRAAVPPIACRPRERTTALAAVATSFLATASIVMAAVLFARGGAGGNGNGGSGAGPGSGNGGGWEGSGSGSATEAAADPGAGDLAGAPEAGAGEGGSEPPTAPRGPITARDAERIALPKGGIAIGGAPATPEPQREPPKWGFTRPEEPPIPRVGAGAQLSAVIGQFPNSRVIINLDVTSSMGSSRDAVAAILPELFTKLEAGTIAVRGFRDILLGEPNVDILPAAPRTTDPESIKRMVDRVMRVRPDGGGDPAETGYQLVLENIRLQPVGTDEAPNIQFVITDAPDKQDHLLPELLDLAQKTRTRIFMIYTFTGTPMLRELTHWAKDATTVPAAP